MQRRRFFLGEESSTPLSIQPFSSTKVDRLVEGDSGSSLYANNRLVGMIVSVDTKSGSGSAIKQSQLHALFGNLVLLQTSERALINPVYYGNRVDRYATVGLQDFVSTNTPFEVVTLDAAAVAANLQRQSRGTAPVYPDNLDYIVSAVIITNNTRNEPNPNYKASAARESSFGKKFLNKVAGNRATRYLYVSSIDVEVQILKPKENQQMTHIERLEYKVPLTDDVDRQELQATLPARAAAQALHATMLKFGLPVTAAEKAESTNLLGRMLGN
jgi:hypothetical protein